MQNLNIGDLIPHRGRMRLIDSILRLDDSVAIVFARVKDSWPLVDGGLTSPIVLIEVVAQAAGVLSSWKKGSNRSAYKAGWLTGIKSAEFFVDTVPIGGELITTVTSRYSLEDYEALEGEVMMGDRCLCRIQLQIFGLKEDKGSHLF